MTSSQPQIAAVTLRHGPCRGFCPAYKVTLRSDGSADWSGERYVDRIGRFHGQFAGNDFHELARFVERAGAGIDWMAGSLDGTCGRWSASLDTEGIIAPWLTVRGVCTFNTAGYSVELRPHRPQSGNPCVLLLDRVVTPPSGVVAQVITDVEVIYSARGGAERVTILPDGVTVEVETIVAPPPFGDSPDVSSRNTTGT